MIGPDIPPDLLDAFDAPLLLLDGAIIIQANRAARSLLGEHLRRRYVLSVIPQPEAAHLLTTGGEGAMPLAGVGGDERRWELSVRAAGPGLRLLQLDDRSAQHAAERMRTDFVANASHELRTPLAALIGIIETLQDDDAASEPATRARFLAIMDSEARRMQRLIGDLMSLSRIEADRYLAPRDAVDLAQTVRIACGEIDGGGRLRLDIEPGGIGVLGERAQLAQLVDNVVSNALRYARPGTPVAVRLERADGLARLVVTDQGEGIAPEHLPRLTERFYRVAAGRSRALGGTGLGLAIVKHIVERHRGRLDIESELGRGTVVAVSLPLADPEG